MLVIRAEQMNAFATLAARAFEDRTYAHLLEYFPRHCELLGEEQMRRVIRHGLQRATKYNLTAECCVRSYIDLMCVLGGGFDSDVLLPWAQVVLRDQRTSDQITRGDRLHEEAWNYIDHIARDYRDASGQPSTARFVGELRQLRHLSAQPVTASTLAAVLEAVRSRFERVLPAKYAFVGETAVRQATSLGIESARAYGILSERGITSFVTMRFVLGAEFDSDPLLPWASRTLRDVTAGDPDQRADRLFAEGVRFLNRWWDSAPDEGGLNDVLGQ
jgi:hypothetical protein